VAVAGRTNNLGVGPKSLSAADREKFVLLLAKHRDELLAIRKRMDARGWYSSEPCYQSVIAAYHALHAAVAAVANLPQVDPPINPYPPPKPVEPGKPMTWAQSRQQQ
jgi:hypothetical protein